MNNNNYVLYYKTNENDRWHSLRPDLPFEQWEDYAKEQGYIEYDIKDLRSYDAMMLHLTTGNVLLEGQYYLSEEVIPYPESIPDDVGKFEVDIVLNEDFIEDEYDFEEIYLHKGLDWGWGELWTSMDTRFIFPNKTVEETIVAQNYLDELPQFLKRLEENKFGVFIMMEYSKFKWLAWVKDDKIRLIQQNYENFDVETQFDVLVNKTWFFDMCNKIKVTMQEYADKDMKRYEEYVEKKYGNKRKSL